MIEPTTLNTLSSPIAPTVPAPLRAQYGTKPRRPSIKGNLWNHRVWTANFNVWLTGFLLAIFVLQLLLIPAALFPIRTYLRIVFFTCSLGMLFIVPGRMKMLPITGTACAIVGIFCLGIFHPNTNSPISGVAAIMLNFAIISPIFWIPRLKLNKTQFRMALIAIWLFNALSASLGILEVIFPAQFGRESQVAQTLLNDVAAGLKITLADGTKIYRPMGFSDSPGGAAVSGYLAILTGAGLLLTRSHVLFKLMFVAGIVAGMFCIYLSHIRSTMVLVGICFLVLIITLLIRGKVAQVIGMVVLVPVLAITATLWAFTVGGQGVVDRFATLTEKPATEVYYANRGIFLEETLIKLAPEYPFGAGLGRWGMTYTYFGDKSSLALPPLHAEIQPTAWLYDGGILLVLLYYFAIILCTWHAFKVCMIYKKLVADLSMVVLILNIAVVANTFSYVPFIGQSGLTFWLLNGCLMALSMTEQEDRRKARRMRKLTNPWLISGLP